MHRASFQGEIREYYVCADQTLYDLSKKAHQSFHRRDIATALKFYQKADAYITKMMGLLSVNDILYVTNKYIMTLRSKRIKVLDDDYLILQKMDQIIDGIQLIPAHELRYPVVAACVTNICTHSLTIKQGDLLARGLPLYWKLAQIKPLTTLDSINQCLYEYFFHFSQNDFICAELSVSEALGICEQNQLNHEKLIHVRHSISIKLARLLESVTDKSFNPEKWTNGLQRIMDVFWVLYDKEKKILARTPQEITVKRMTSTLSLLYKLKLLQNLSKEDRDPFMASYRYIKKQIQSFVCKPAIQRSIAKSWDVKFHLKHEVPILPLAYKFFEATPPNINVNSLKAKLSSANGNTATQDLQAELANDEEISAFFARFSVD